MRTPSAPATERQLPPLGVAIVGSNTLAVAAELVAATQGYQDFAAIRRRKNHTSLPVLMDCDGWNDQLRRVGYLKAKERMRRLDDTLTELVGGRRFDCFIHHSKDLFCQFLSTHPLCDRYFYLEEGMTSLLGKRFGLPRTRKLQPFLWKWRSRAFYRNRLNIYHTHYDFHAPNYGGAYALSREAFLPFPNRVELSLGDLPSGEPLHEDIVVFLDGQYVGKPIEPEYTRALVDCLAGLVDTPSSVALKFHPREEDPARKKRILDAVAGVPLVTAVNELPASFVGERMTVDHPVKAVIGTSAIGIYLGAMGIPTYTFAARVPILAQLAETLPPKFHEMCKPA